MHDINFNRIIEPLPYNLLESIAFYSSYLNYLNQIK